MLGNLRFIKRPTLWVGACLSLSIALAAALTVTAIIESILLNPLPYPNSERIVRVLREQGPERVGPPVSGPAFADISRAELPFSAVAAVSNGTIVMSAKGEATRLLTALVTPNWFEVMGLSPQAGRFLSGPPVQADPTREVVLSHSAWRDLFGGDPAVLGSTVVLDGSPYQIVGVAPPDLLLPGRASLALPIAIGEGASRGSNRYNLFARLQDGVSIEQAQSRLDATANAMAQAYPENHEGLRLRAEPITVQLVRSTETVTQVLGGAVGLLLLVGAASLGNLLLADATARRREFATRIALGAPAQRLAGQLMIETGAAVGAALLFAIGLGYGAIHLLQSFGANWIARPERLHIGPMSLLSVALVALLIAVVTSVVAARSILRGNSGDAGSLRTRGSSADRASLRLRRTLVVAQFALSFVLLLGAGLLGESLKRVLAEDPGFNADGLWTGHITLPTAHRPDASDEALNQANRERGTRFLADFEASLRAIPGVSAAGLVLRAPIVDGPGFNGYVRAADSSVGAKEVLTEYQQASPGYFEAMGLTLLAGRLLPIEFDREDQVVINDALAEQLFGDTPALGRKLDVGDGIGREIVGIVRGVRQAGLEATVRGEMYLSWGNDKLGTDLAVVVRSPLEAASLSPQVRAELARIDREVPLFNVAMMSDAIAESTQQRRFLSAVMIGFAAASLAVVAVALFALLSQSVVQRQREFGVRLAIGATGAMLRRLIGVEGLRLVGYGVVSGGLLAALLQRLVQSQLHEISAAEPSVVLSQLLLLLGATLLVVAPVAWRASRTSPMAALRDE